MANRFLSNIRINDAYTLPASDGTSGQVISTDGAGNLSFTDASTGGAPIMYRDDFAGDGSTVLFQLANPVSNIVQTQVYIDGTYQEKETYSVNGQDLTFLAAPPNGTSIEVISLTSINFAGDFVLDTLRFTGGTADQGTLSWNTEDETLDLIVSPNVTYQIGQELGHTVRNLSGVTLNNGAVVRVTGASGNKITVDLADNTAELGSSETFAVVTETISNNSTGKVTTEGLVRGLDTSAFAEGVAIWLGTNGAFTDTKPLTPNHLVHIGWVVRSHATEGAILVKVSNGWEMEELHDVLITNVADKDMLVWNSTLGYWENSKTLGDITTGNITTDGTVDGVDISAFKAAYDVHTHVEGDITDFGNYLTNITHDTVNNKLVVTTRDAATFDVDLTQYIDDSNLARLISGSLDAATGIATFTRDDATTFTVDFSALFDDTDTNDFLTGATFNTADGVLTLNVSNQTDVTVDLDGRYLESYTETDTLATVTGRGATTSSPITIENNSLQNLDFTISNTQGNTTDRVRILTEAGGQSWDIENDQNLDVFKIRDGNAATDVFILTNGAPSNSLVVSSSGDISTVGGITASGTITSGSITTIKGSSPYIQWKNSSDTRLGYIQHNETDLVMSVDTGNIVLDGLVRMNRDGQSGNVIEIDHVENSNWPFVFKTSSVGNDNHSGFWVNGDGTPDMRLRATDGSVKAIIHSNGTSYIAGGNLLVGTANNLTSQALQVNGFVDITNLDAALRFYNGSSFRGGFGDGQWATGNSSYTNDLSIITTNRFIIQTGGSNDPRVLIDSNGLARFNNGIRLPDTNGTVNSLWGIYGWDSQLQFTKRNLSTDGYEGTAMFLDYGGLYAQSDYSFRAPIFYDSNNTGYYLDPASNSRINTIYFDTLRNPDGNWILGQDNATTFSVGSSAVSDTMLINATYITQTSRVSLTDASYYIGSPSYGFRFNNNADNINSLIVNNSGDSIAHASMRAPIFYDSNNTAWYTDPAGRSLLNTLQLGGASSDTTNLKLDVQGNMAIRGNNGLYYGVTTNNYNSWTTRMYASSSTQYFNAQQFIFDNQGYGSTTFATINSQGVSANIFRDSADTNYYLDPASDSRLNNIVDARYNTFSAYRHSGSDFVNGTLVATDIPATATNGASFVIEVTGKSYTTNVPPFSFMAQGYLYNNTIIATSGVNNGDLRLTYIKVMELNGYLHFWWPRISYWNSFEVRVRDAGGGPTNRATNIIDSSDPSGATKKVQINLAMSTLYGYNTNAGDLYAQTYYDANDTSRYVDPNSQSNMGKILFMNTVNQGTPVGEALVGRNYAYNTLELKGYGAEMMIGSQSQDLHINYRYCNGVGNNTYTPQNWYWRAGTSSSLSNHHFGYIYGWQFYDESNTAYYLNPDGTSLLYSVAFNGTTSLNNNELRLVSLTDGNHFLRKIATGYSGVTIDGPQLQGHQGGELTTNYTGDNWALRWGIGGNVTINNSLSINKSSQYGEAVNLTYSGSNSSAMLIRNNTGATATAISFFYSSAPQGARGSITVSSTSTAYNTSSDYRLKENVIPMTGSLERVDQLNPTRFNFIGDDKTVDGFLAHEAAEVVPEAVTGVKDEVDEEGNPVYQGIDQAKLVPLLVGAIQELKAEVEALKQQLNGTN